MRLIDSIQQVRKPLVVQRESSGEVYRLSGCSDLASDIAKCPSRYVLSDDLVQACTELAYCAGDRLASCLDLIRVPAQAVWVEWNDAAAIAGAAEVVDSRDFDQAHTHRRAGAFLRSSRGGRSAIVWTLWKEDDGEPLLAPMEACLELDEPRFDNSVCSDPFSGGWVKIRDVDPAIQEVLDCGRLRFDPSWACYYREIRMRPPERTVVLQSSIASVARDLPMLLAFFLLLASREGVRLRPIALDALNRKRLRLGKRPLLDHLEASLAIGGAVTSSPVGLEDTGFASSRRHPRCHHVRGHLVRRYNTVFWRRPHMRGSARHGTVLSRTVTLSFTPGRASGGMMGASAAAG